MRQPYPAHPLTQLRRYPYPYPVYPQVRIGQVPGPTPPAPPPPPPKPEETFTLSGLGAAIRQVTPTLLVVGIATGMALAIGSGIGGAIVNRLFTSKT